MGDQHVNMITSGQEQIISSEEESTFFNEPDVIRIKNLSLSLNDQLILDGLSFVLKMGHAVLLRGENGSGKTTLLNLITGFIRPDSGSITLNLNGASVNVAHTSPEALARFGLGRLWQDIRLFPTLTVLENVLAATQGLSGQNPALVLAMWPRVRRQEKEAREQAMYHLELVGMADRATSSGDKLSLGQMKRVALARLLQCGAKLLLLDEPLAGLDHDSAEKWVQILGTLCKQDGKSLIVVEHQHERVGGLCDETWFMANGKLSMRGLAT